MKCKNCDSMEICAKGLCKKCYSKARYAANKDEANERSKAWYEANRDEFKAKCKLYRDSHKNEINTKAKLYRKANKNELSAKAKLYYEANRNPTTPRFGSDEFRIKCSCSHQGIDIEDFNGFSDKGRPHLTPITRCIQLNKRFPGSNGHHIMSRVVIFMPKDIHKSISHNFKSGKNMNEINQLAINYLCIP